MLRTGMLLALICLVLGAALCELKPVMAGDPYSENLNGYKVCTDQLFRDVVTQAGYPMVSHKVKTQDGYILRIFRIQGKNSQITGGKKVVILQHGLFDSADNFVINGDHHSLAFVLADKGYDVWISNSRGNKYSRSHVSLNPSSKEFWDYSFQEMGKYDIQANIEFILQQTGKSKLTYIGHSQGTTQMFAALSSESSDFINSKVDKFIALAPVVLLRTVSSVVIAKMAADTILVKALQVLGITEILPGGCSKSSPVKWLTSQFCMMATYFCQLFMGITDDKPWYNSPTIMGTLNYHYPSGTSLKTLVHFQQMMAQNDQGNPKFMMFDYGSQTNQKKYGSETPTEYDLRRIKIPVRLLIGNQDKLATPSDNKILADRLRSYGVNVKEYYYDNCGHSTFVWAKDSSKIYGDVISELN